MGYQVSLSPSVRRDLRDIIRFISFDLPDRALQFGGFLIRSIRHLETFPEMGRIVPEFRDPAIREIIARNYRVVYRVNHAEQRLDVIRFWHGARGLPQL